MSFIITLSNRGTVDDKTHRRVFGRDKKLLDSGYKRCIEVPALSLLLDIVAKSILNQIYMLCKTLRIEGILTERHA